MSRTAGRAYIAQKLAEELGLFRSQTPYKLVCAVIDHMKDCIFENGRLSISKFGQFYVLEKKSRKGRNPKTGESITLPKRTLVKFKPSPVLKALFD
ncbi:MAG: HU family DNA-binding protein [Deltaproteobacteria bacterium]|nr:HU family DNA-binding protein [Deltaproteobacteria bacterium]